jgi:hypothetical protein
MTTSALPLFCFYLAGSIPRESTGGAEQQIPPHRLKPVRNGKSEFFRRSQRAGSLPDKISLPNTIRMVFRHLWRSSARTILQGTSKWYEKPPHNRARDSRSGSLRQPRLGSRTRIFRLRPDRTYGEPGSWRRTCPRTRFTGCKTEQSRRESQQEDTPCELRSPEQARLP